MKPASHEVILNELDKVVNAMEGGESNIFQSHLTTFKVLTEKVLGKMEVPSEAKAEVLLRLRRFGERLEPFGYYKEQLHILTTTINLIET